MLPIERIWRVRDATDCAIAEAQEIRAEFYEPINWSDLRCNRALFWQDDQGTSAFAIEISGVDPHADGFRNWIADRVENETGISVIVRFDW